MSLFQELTNRKPVIPPIRSWLPKCDLRRKHYTGIYVPVINHRDELVNLAKELGVRPDWHEPDEQEVTAEVRGKSFDNAGFYGMEREAEMIGNYDSDCAVEMYVRLFQDNQPVADVPLATLFAWATGYEA